VVWQAEQVDPWTVGLIAVIVIGLAVIVFGALSDRAKNKRAVAEMTAPPQRYIPQFRPDSAAPRYLSELQARRKPDDAEPTDLTSAEREELARQIKDPSTTTIEAGYASRDFVTDSASSWAVLDAPRILVCSEPVESTRELLTIMEKLILSRSPLVVVAPALAKEVRGTLEVNRIRQKMDVNAVTASRTSDLAAVAAATGAQIRSRNDLQAGYAWLEHLGSCGRWVSSAKQSFVITPPVAPSQDPT
jgi:hypothetical protein